MDRPGDLSGPGYGDGLHERTELSEGCDFGLYSVQAYLSGR